MSFSGQSPLCATFRVCCVVAIVCGVTTSAQLIAAPLRCSTSEAYYVPDGRDYRGSVNVTASGIPCQKWTLQFPHPHDIVAPNPLLGLGDDNFCRNPFGDTTVGCYTIAPDVVYAPCSIGPPCTLSTATRQAVVTPSDGAVVVGGVFVSTTCWPGPCDIYYTLDGSAPDQSTSPLYQHPVWISTSSVMTIVAYYLDGSRLYNMSSITVRQLSPQVSLFPPAGTYSAPVLVALAAVNNASLSSVAIALSTGVPPFAYTGPFWLSDDVTVTVVQGTAVLATGTFLFRTAAPAVPTVIPQAGTYLGSVKILIQPISGSSVEWSAAWNGSLLLPITSPVLTLSTFGSTSLTVQARFITGVVSQSSFRYVVLPLSAPDCNPPPGNYTTAINVSCADPRGNLATITFQASANNPWVALAAPGVFTLVSAYLDDSGNTINTTLVYRLVAVQLAPPLVAPCGGTFVAPSLQINVAPATPGAGSVLTYASNATVLQQNSSAAVLQSQIANGLVVVAAFSVSADPMLTMSLPTTCTYTFSSGPFLSSTVRAVGVVNTTQLASCLLLPPSAAAKSQLSILPVGPYLLLNMQNVSNDTRVLYGQRIAGCLSDADSCPLLEGNFSLVVQLNTPRESTVAAGAPPLAVSVTGYSVERCLVKAVRVAYSCDDVGVLLPVAQGQVWFQSVLSGTFRFCAASIDGGTRPAFYAPIGPIITVTPAAVASPMVVPCGSPLTAPLTVAINADAASIDGGPWSQMVSAFLLPAGKPRVISATLGDQTVTCVFWPPAVLNNLTYSFVNDFLSNTSTLAVVAAASVAANAPLRVFIATSPSCTVASLGNAVFQSGTVAPIADTSTSVTLTLDDPVPWSALQQLPVTNNSLTPLVVCVTDLVTAIAITPTVAPLNWLTAQTMPCPSCPSTLCLRNGSCVCSTLSGQSWVCDAAQSTSAGTPLITTMRLILLGAYVVLTVVMIALVRSQRSEEAHH